MKKITFFTYDAYLGGGTERVMIMIANELSKKYQVEIVSVKKHDEKPFYYINDNIKIIDLDIKKTEPLIFMLPFVKQMIKKKLKDYETDVFVCAGMRYVPISIFMRKKAKFVAWEHYTSYINKKWSVGEIGRKLASKKADKVIVLTKKDAKRNQELFKTPEDKIVQIYNPNDEKTVSNEYNINSKSIITAGRFCTLKGYDMLVDVAVKIFEKHKDWQWHIYGKGELFDDIENKIKDKGLENNVILKGLEKNLHEKYKEYAMYVMTSRSEGFPMVNIEAQSAKLPIVSFNCPCGPDELIIDGESGYLIDCFDIEKMADRINYLIEHSDERKRMSDNTINNLDKVKLDNIIKEWNKIIN